MSIDKPETKPEAGRAKLIISRLNKTNAEIKSELDRCFNQVKAIKGLVGLESTHTMTDLIEVVKVMVDQNNCSESVIAAPSVELKEHSAEVVPVIRLLTDKKLLSSVNTLADALLV